MSPGLRIRDYFRGNVKEEITYLKTNITSINLKKKKLPKRVSRITIYLFNAAAGCVCTSARLAVCALLDSHGLIKRSAVTVFLCSETRGPKLLPLRKGCWKAKVDIILSWACTGICKGLFLYVSTPAWIYSFSQKERKKCFRTVLPAILGMVIWRLLIPSPPSLKGLIWIT